MSEYTALVKWQRNTNEPFLDNKYSRGHVWQFDGGVSVQASSSPHVVPLPYSIEENVDPEEAYVASLSSCHMLFFLSFAAEEQFTVQRYADQAVGIMKKDATGVVSMKNVTLKPKVIFSGENQPSVSQLEKLHHKSHKHCFIANSVKTEITIQIQD